MSNVITSPCVPCSNPFTWSSTCMVFLRDFVLADVSARQPGAFCVFTAQKNTLIGSKYPKHNFRQWRSPPWRLSINHPLCVGGRSCGLASCGQNLDLRWMVPPKCMVKTKRVWLFVLLSRQPPWASIYISSIAGFPWRWRKTRYASPTSHQLTIRDGV